MEPALSIDVTWWQAAFFILDYTIKILAVGFVPEGRRPSSSTAWLLAILLIPFLGLPLFFLMGSPFINRRRHEVYKNANEQLNDAQGQLPDMPPHLCNSREVASMIALNRRLTGFPAVIGDQRGLLADYDQAIKRMAEVIDSATDYVHVQVYIQSWDETTDVFYQALADAVGRGVKVRLLFDQIGSLKYPGYRKLGKRLDAIGVDWHLMMPLQPWKWRFRRPDLRNHRKIIIVDGTVGFMGSLNLIDRSYRIRKNVRAGRQWIDYMVELSGPIVTSMESVFAIDWYLESDEVLDPETRHPTAHDATQGTAQVTMQASPQPTTQTTAPPAALTQTEYISDANVLQMIPSGPGYSSEPNLRMFNQVVHHAKNRLVLCSPYFIPDESLLEAVTSAAFRGVRVELYVSERADQFTVHHAQSSYYQALLEAGVHIYQFPAPYVLHSKFALADPEDNHCDSVHAVGMLGSSNMDMRSFGLNYESTLFVVSGSLIDDLNELAATYRAVSRPLTLEKWEQRGFIRRYVDNVMRLTSALQ
ncbi:phospholipase D-like domain-containing protein [Corynebacterium pseudodiphtheriticum]|uniref:Phospholipase D-like domain-containing protein n=1 Tax=Corynebacterium pseudodiphtheriticum TaxID=37637 RepID=A0ABT7FV50_9CORY|nr:phospholipase D-like domain-containing protein [Corynebacterium pseudodiphtheriticum]MDK4289819.1 phospholipase D-like domain-containing protein [Corynebacterium pseudodiphtheriticum]